MKGAAAAAAPSSEPCERIDAPELANSVKSVPRTFALRRPAAVRMAHQLRVGKRGVARALIFS